MNIVCHEATLGDVMAGAGLTLPNGRQLDVDDFGGVSLDEMVGELAGGSADDPAALLDRRCETAEGTQIHPTLLLRALLTGHVRRVVVDTDGVVTDLGRRSRLFTGSAREAAKLLVRTCSHPGCSVPSRFAQVDHIEEWADGNGSTDQYNSAVSCGGHNRFKHRQRWKTRRDEYGRCYSIRPDGTIVLPVGERPPDLSLDELARITRARVAELRALRSAS
ncbi:MAG: HNH endonuclease signature motif containing protein [Ilumatobacteraceae bacterium]|nr:HNH endonuclease signature motif containing protein [Ilumatobacteraceae bacterium]